MASIVLYGTYLRSNKHRCLFCRRNHSLQCPHREISRTRRSILFFSLLYSFPFEFECFWENIVQVTHKFVEIFVRVPWCF